MAAADASTFPGNEEIARILEQVAERLEDQAANPWRVRAWRNGARTVRGLEEPLAERLAVEGPSALAHLSGIGPSLGRAIAEIAQTGRLALLDRLNGESSPEELLATVPGLGPELATRIHQELGIEGLHELEEAARDGRLGRVRGLGPRRVQLVREALAGRFSRARPAARGEPAATAGEPAADAPSVGELLDVDREYRERAARNALPRIAPRRFNPTGAAWLPVLHTRRGDRHYTALYSNTARAHELGTTHDWVVIYRDGGGGRGQWTVVTAAWGPLRGHRVVRGRERECEAEFAPRLDSKGAAS